MDKQVSALRKKQLRTLEQIFKTPVSATIKWSDIESLIKALGGEVSEGRGSRCRFILNGHIAKFHRPHPSPDTDKGAIVSLREWLESIGVIPS
ncbi:type II toxin-antitoxin system HicA family toxin [Xenorhabdus sp. SF857]|uniref:type II toxin-antitoxin system HicA family toxin n=1 Tax=Xenorhabdus bakwenae TaxID=3026967 RepID=UPI002557CE33|nr:type II toxin-antitoxin system HicA family toxin [Xenorhabdus sp. SF857]WFQ81073.1 type II toxin-antitoxin system HicA family toxin [Xenorhabdus sp. SF857]